MRSCNRIVAQLKLMQDGVGVEFPLHRVVQPVLDQPRIRSGRYRAGRGGQTTINLALESKQIPGAARGALPRQAEGLRFDESCAAVEDVDVDPDRFDECDILHPCARAEQSSQVLADRGAARRPREYVLLDGRLVEHVDEFRTCNRSVAISNGVLQLDRLRAGNVEPVVVAKPAVPGIAAAAEL